MSEDGVRPGRARVTVERRGLIVRGRCDRVLWVRGDATGWWMPYRAPVAAAKGLTEKSVRAKLARATAE